MIYVAISRVRTFDGLYITDLEEKRLLAHKSKNGKILGPCDIAPLREFHRLELANFLELSEKESKGEFLMSLVEWKIEYVVCKACGEWCCFCTCNEKKTKQNKTVNFLKKLIK